jgi:hypothetical protein
MKGQAALEVFSYFTILILGLSIILAYYFSILEKEKNEQYNLEIISYQNYINSKLYTLIKNGNNTYTELEIRNKLANYRIKDISIDNDSQNIRIYINLEKDGQNISVRSTVFGALNVSLTLQPGRHILLNQNGNVVLLNRTGNVVVP